MTVEFHGYVVRATGATDAILSRESTSKGDPLFWLKQDENHESFLVAHQGLNVAFFQVEQHKQEEARLHFQSFSEASPRIVLWGVLKLVPLIEKALAQNGVRAVFFTSHSLAMASFMQDKMGYTPAGDGGRDGIMMAKRLEIPDVRTV